MDSTIYQPRVMNFVYKSIEFYLKFMIKCFRYLMDASLLFNGAVQKRNMQVNDISRWSLSVKTGEAVICRHVHGRYKKPSARMCIPKPVFFCKILTTAFWSTHKHTPRQGDFLYLLEMRFLHVEVLECNLYDFVATCDEGVEQTVDVVLVRVWVVRAAKWSVLFAICGREQQTFATWKSQPTVTPSLRNNWRTAKSISTLRHYFAGNGGNIT